MRSFSLNPPTYCVEVVHSCLPISSSVTSRIASKYEGGVHPHFGTINFTPPLQNGEYIEIASPLDHPATEQTPWSKAVSKKTRECGGWLTWDLHLKIFQGFKIGWYAALMNVTSNVQMEAI
jgi:hypothetical protein